MTSLRYFHLVFIIFLTLLIVNCPFSVCLANEIPLQKNWAPSVFGSDDQVGSINWITPNKVLNSLKLVKQGKVVTLGKVYQNDIPTFGNRNWKLIVPGLPTGKFGGNNDLVYNDEYVTTEIGQIGTQFDGLGHIGVRTSKGDFFYNGNFLEEFGTAYGLNRLGIEQIAASGYVTRGVLLDIAGYRGVDRLPIPTGSGKNDPGLISISDIKGALSKEKIAPLRQGDIVIFHTGHGKYWGSNWDSLSDEQKAENRRIFNSGEPGPGITTCRYLSRQKIAMVGSDTWGVEAIPGESSLPTFDCHMEWLVKNGITITENLDVSQLLEDRVYEFLFVFAPLKIKGATGSPSNPLAIY